MATLRAAKIDSLELQKGIEELESVVSLMRDMGEFLIIISGST